MKAHERMTRGWDQGAESRKKLSRAHHTVRLAATRVLDPISDAAVLEDAETFNTERREGAVAEQSLAALSVAGRDGHPGVNVEAARRAGTPRREGEGRLTRRLKRVEVDGWSPASRGRELKLNDTGKRELERVVARFGSYIKDCLWPVATTWLASRTSASTRKMPVGL